MPPSGKAYRVEVTINADCSLDIGDPQEVSADEAQGGQSASGGGPEHRTGFRRIGSTSQYLDPDYHMDAHLWDPYGIVLTRLVTDLNWTTDGVTITGWNAGGYQAYHGEYSCGGGWNPVSSYLISDQGGTGDVWIRVHSHAEWSYQGVFDCSGSTFYNIFDNYVWGDIRSIGGCDYYYYLRATYAYWHLQIQCYNPVITKVDQLY